VFGKPIGSHPPPRQEALPGLYRFPP